jgi:hypothetical protein
MVVLVGLLLAVWVLTETLMYLELGLMLPLEGLERLEVLVVPLLALVE